MNQTIFEHIPLVRTHMTTTNIMFCMILALLPSAGYGMYVYGLHAALLMGICVVTCVAVEAILSLVLQRGLTILDYSAVVTGLIGGMLLPGRAPYYMAVILGAIAAVSKAAFGGIGKNWLNPAGLGKLVLVIVFHSAMVDYTGGEYGAVGALTLIKQGEELTLGNMLLGHVAGPIGTGSAITILIGAAFLFLVGIIDIYIPIAYLAAFVVFWTIFGGYGLSPYHLAVQLAGGSLLFTAFIMAEDNTTSPMSREGKLIYGAILGLLTAIIRRIGAVENGALIALLVCNLSVRWLDTKTFPAIFGVDATVRRVRRDRRRRQENPDRAKAAADSISGYQEFEEHVVPKGAMDGSETAGTIDAEAIEAFNNRRAVTYDTASVDTAAVNRELSRQRHAMRQSMPIFGQSAPESAPTNAPANAAPQQSVPPTARRQRRAPQEEPTAIERQTAAALENEALQYTGAIPQEEVRQAARHTQSIPQEELEQALRQTGTIPQGDLQQAMQYTGTIPQGERQQPMQYTGTIPQDQFLQQTQAIPQDLYMPQNAASYTGYALPTYPNGQPMVDVNGNPLPLLDEYGNPVIDEYGNMIWGQPMQMPPMQQMPYGQPYAQPYGAPKQGMPAMPVYGQAPDYEQTPGYGQTPDYTQNGGYRQTVDDRQGSYGQTAGTTPVGASAGTRGTSRKRVTEEPVSRDTDMMEVARILEAARAAEQQGGDSILKDVQYMDLGGGDASTENQQAAGRPRGTASGRTGSRTRRKD